MLKHMTHQQLMAQQSCLYMRPQGKVLKQSANC